MKVSAIDFKLLEIPFKRAFAHASAVRQVSETFIVSVTSVDGKKGWGESCPRDYVTGETFKSCSAFFLRFNDFLMRIQSLVELRRFVEQFESEINKNPSAWCAIELAILDLLAIENGVTVEGLLGFNSLRSELKYSGVIGISKPSSLIKNTILFRLFGFTDFKIKLSGQKEKDLQALIWLKRFGLGQNRVRVDANNLWSSKSDCVAYMSSLSEFYWAIEEPLGANNIQELKEIAGRLEKKIILDESFLNASNLPPILNDREIFVPNVRVSKMGGVLRTLDIVQTLVDHKVNWILGSHVGETSLLTRVALLIESKFAKDPPMAKEGAFSTHLLKTDPFDPNLKFNFGAKISIEDFKDSLGWGLTFQYGVDQ